MVARKGQSRKNEGGAKRAAQTLADDAKVIFTKELITPAIAEQMLDTALVLFDDKVAIDTYARAMEADSWVMNGQPLIFDEEGHLIDGAQRLAASIQSGKSFETMVARNVRADTLHTIDQHRRRNYQGVLDSRGYQDTGALQRTMSKLIKIENGVLGRETISISWSRFDRVLAANRDDLIEAVKLANRFDKCALHSTPRPALCFMALRAGKRDQLISFLQQLTDHWTEPMDSPARVFNMSLSLWAHNKKFESSQGRSGAGQQIDSVLAHAILYFNEYCKGTKLHHALTWTPDYGVRNVTKIIDGEEKIIKEKATELRFDREAAPANLGMPVVDGYPGLAEGHFDRSRLSDELVGEIADQLHSGAAAGAGEASVDMMLVTPELAAKWLSPNINRGNRKTQINHVKAIERDIKSGNWMMNAQPICFTKDPMQEYPAGEEPRLLNGQHRLLAIRNAGEGVELPIGANIPEAAFATFDTHAKRTLRRTGPKGDDRVLTAAARFQYKEDNDIPLASSDTPTLTASELLEVVNNHPGLEEAFPLSRKAGMVKIGSAGVMTYFIYRVRRENPTLAEEFLHKIETGLNLADSSDPAGKLRSELANKARGSGGRTRKELIEALMSHWNNYKRWATKNKKAPAKDDKKQEEIQENLF